MASNREARLQGALVLVALARWPLATDADAKAFLDDFTLLSDFEIAHEAPDTDRRRTLRQWYQFDDSIVALYGWHPLINSLQKNKAELTVPRMKKAQGQAKRILADLIQLSRQRLQSGKLLDDHPALALVRRPLNYRFVLPSFNPNVHPKYVPGWGRWQPELKSIDDILTWAAAEVLSTKTVRHIGECEQCGRYYVAKRPSTHRFCPTGDCRDKYWQAKTGPERTRRSRLKAKGKSIERRAKIAQAATTLKPR